MKISALLAFAITLAFSGNTHATLLTDVGSVDHFVASTTLSNSGGNTELSWVRDILNDQSITLDRKYEDNDVSWELLTNETDVYFMALENTPAYFLLKFGNGNTNLNSHYLFQNVGDLSFAVIDFASADVDLTNATINRISHVTGFDGDSTQPQGTPIPEPMTISLFALALLGLARRK